MKQEQGQLVAASSEIPLTSDEEIGRTLAGLQGTSYYTPGDGSIRGPGSEPDKAFDQSISVQNFNAMNYDSITNTQASDVDHLVFN